MVNRSHELLRARGAAAGPPSPPPPEPVAPASDAGHTLGLERAVTGLADGYRAVFVLPT